MKYLHFTRVDKDWFYTMNTSDKTKTFTPPTFNDLNGWTKMLNIHSKAAALTELKSKFPDFEPILTTYNVNTSNRTPFQKKSNYRNAERRFKDRMDAISADDNDNFDTKDYYTYDEIFGDDDEY